MSLPQFAADSVSIVVRGRFEPANLSPKWMLEQDLIGIAEFEKVEFELFVPGDMAIFTAGWLRCQVSSDVLQMLTKEEAEFERLRDLVAGIIHALPDTRVSALGLNRQVHFSVEDWRKWHSIGDVLAQKDVWEGVLNLPGMRSLTVSGVRPDLYSGQVQVQVEPSNVFPAAIFVAYNDHFGLTIVESQPANREELMQMPSQDAELTAEKVSLAVKILTEEWAPSMRRAEAIIARIAQQGRV